MRSADAKTLLRPHYPALDGLRGVAVLSVCLTHYCTIAWPGLHDVFFWGFSTVDLFFVLSGFLITGILYDTRPFPRFFRNFYIRRALRILPVFLLVWAVLFAIAAFLHPVWDRYQLSFLIYLGNLFMAGGAAGYHTDPSYFYYVSASGHRFYATIGHLWTLCQEEQFYLVWPLVMWLVRSRRVLFWGCLAGAGMVLGLRFWLLFFGDPRLIAGDLLYDSPFTRFDSHLIGAALALYLRGPQFLQATVDSVRRRGRWLLGGATGLFVLVQVAIGGRWPLTHHHPVVSTVGFTLDCVASAGLLLACLDKGTWAARLLGTRGLMAIGRVSYGFYVFHFLPVQFFKNQRPWAERQGLLWAIPVVALGLSYAAAVVSFRWLEGPVLELKRRWAPGPRVARQLVVAGGADAPSLHEGRKRS
jgi:peptidoglycan/LPS O-acetylase OafA/YrhL